MKRVSYNGKALDSTLDELLKNKQNIILQRFQTGSVEVPKSGMISINKKEDAAARFPVFVYVVKHHSKGFFLIDSGLDSSFINKPFGSQKGPLTRMLKCKGHLEEGQCIKDILETNNINPEGVILSHLHYDHAAGMLDLPDVHECFIGKNEVYNAFKPLYYGNWLKNVDVLNEISFSHSTILPPFKEAVDFFGDNSLIVLKMPGHTVGHIGFLVNGVEETSLIVGDAYPFRTADFIEKGPGSFTQDKASALETAASILKFEETYPDARIYMGHGE